MSTNTTSWHHHPRGERVMTDRPPFFVFSDPARRQNPDAVARQRVAALAGL
jgi:hypothetical protein